MSRGSLVTALFASLLVAAMWPHGEARARAGPTASSAGGSFPATWVYGAACGVEPQLQLQVHAYDDDTYILRQSPCPNFEVPFLYLLFGREQALLIDTGSAPGVDLFPVVRDLVDGWLARTGIPSVELVVVHSHSHGDHVANDAEFVGQPGVNLVQPGLAPVISYVGFTG